MGLVATDRSGSIGRRRLPGLRDQRPKKAGQTPDWWKKHTGVFNQAGPKESWETKDERQLLKAFDIAQTLRVAEDVPYRSWAWRSAV